MDAIGAKAKAAQRNPLLDEYAAAKYLGMAAATLRRWRCTGDGPDFIKLGRCVRYEQSALDRFVAAARRRSTSDQGGHARARSYVHAGV